MGLFFEDKKIKMPRVFHMTGCGFRIGTGAPEKVGPARPLYCASGVLVEDEPAQGGPVADILVAADQGLLGVDISQCPGREKLAVGGDRAARRDLHAQVAERASGAAAEKDEAGVVVEYPVHLVRVGRQVLPDTLHGHLLQRNPSLIDQELSDAPIGMAVCGGVLEADEPSVRQFHPSGTLDLEEEQVHGIAQPGEDAGVFRNRRVRLDVPAVRVRNQAVSVHPADDALAGQRIGKHG